MKITKFSIALLLALGCTSQAFAAIVSHGDFTSDTVSGLDWLDFAFTDNELYGNVEGRLSTDLAGWRFATEIELDRLISNTLGHAPASGWATANADLILLTDAIGVTSGTVTNGSMNGFLLSQLGRSDVLIKDLGTNVFRGRQQGRVGALFGPSRDTYQANAWLVRQTPVNFLSGVNPDPVNLIGFDDVSPKPGGMKIDLPLVTSGDSSDTPLTVSFSTQDATLAIPPGGFAIPGSQLQTWDIDFDNSVFNDIATLTFAYDPTLLGGTDESSLAIFHTFSDGSGSQILFPTSIDTTLHTLTVEVDRFSTFDLVSAAAPEPTTLFVWGGLGMCFAAATRRRRNK